MTSFPSAVIAATTTAGLRLTTVQECGSEFAGLRTDSLATERCGSSKCTRRESVCHFSSWLMLLLDCTAQDYERTREKRMNSIRMAHREAASMISARFRSAEGSSQPNYI